MTRSRVLAFVLAVALAACGGTVETPGEPLRLLSDALPQAFVGEPYQATLRAAGGLRPFAFELSEGELPPGVELVGGALVGTPTAIGRYAFTITVSDASLNTTFEAYLLTVAEVPPPTLAFNAPETEVQRPVTLRAVVDGRQLRALRTRAAWDPELFELVEGSLTVGDAFAVVSSAEPGAIQVDLAALGEPLSGERQLFSFQLAPRADAPLDGAPRLLLDTQTEFLASGRHFFSQAVEGSPTAGRAPEPQSEGLDDGEPAEPDPDDPNEEDEQDEEDPS